MVSFRSFQTFADVSLCLDLLLNYKTETEISTKEIILRQQNYLRTTAVIIKTESIYFLLPQSHSPTFSDLDVRGHPPGSTIDCICLENYD